MLRLVSFEQAEEREGAGQFVAEQPVEEVRPRSGPFRRLGDERVSRRYPPAAD